MKNILLSTGMVFALILSGNCGCESEPDLAPEERIAQDFQELSWSLMKPLDSSTECKKIGQALAAWEKQNAARFRELAAKVTKLEGARARNFQRVQQRFRQVAGYCIHPKTSGGLRVPQMEHDDNVERVYKMLPDFKLGFELK